MPAGRKSGRTKQKLSKGLRNKRVGFVQSWVSSPLPPTASAKRSRQCLWTPSASPTESRLQEQRLCPPWGWEEPSFQLQSAWRAFKFSVCNQPCTQSNFWVTNAACDSFPTCTFRCLLQESSRRCVGLDVQCLVALLCLFYPVQGGKGIGVQPRGRWGVGEEASAAQLLPGSGR